VVFVVNVDPASSFTVNVPEAEPLSRLMCVTVPVGTFWVPVAPMRLDSVMVKLVMEGGTRRVEF
jgi:hypothetical protein